MELHTDTNTVWFIRLPNGEKRGPYTVKSQAEHVIISEGLQGGIVVAGTPDNKEVLLG